MENNTQEVPFNLDSYKAILLAKYKALVGSISAE